MSDDLNLNSITAEVIAAQLAGVGDRLTGEFKKVWTKNFTNFKKYIDQAKTKYGKTKTLLYKNESVLISDIYVGMRLGTDRSGSSISDEEAFQLLADGRQLLVSATAGAGKSFFAKVAFLKLLSSGRRLPIMIELRNLNDTERGIIDYLAAELRGSGIDAPSDVISDWIKNGKFALILDGYDELSTSAARRIDLELKELQRTIGNSALLITSRPSEKLEYLTEVKVLEVRPFNKKQAVALIDCLKYDSKIKKKFLTQLRGDLFETHKEFLSNPLLLTIMLMTYGDIAEIPTKMHVFYEHAFDVLFYKHDASKGMYRREILSKLAIDDFKSILSSVSASGYIRSKVAFSNTELLAFIRKAKKITGLKKVSPEKYKKDLLQSVCMLKLDGNHYTYNHRSFQEYFAALFLINFPHEKKNDLYKRYLERGAWDNALFLAFDINQSLVESEFIWPMIQELKKAMGDSTLDAMKSWFEGFHFQWLEDETQKQPHYGIINANLHWSFLTFIERAYDGILKGKAPRFGNLLTKSSFRKEFGNTTEGISVSLESLQPGQSEMLDRIGVTDVTLKHIEFVDLIIDHLEERKSLVSADNFEDWL